MIAIIGAGISGLTSALTLQKMGHNIMIIDKGRSVGGRLATRYFESNGVKRYIDTASHYIELTQETPDFQKLLSSRYPDQAGSRKVIGKVGINGIAKDLSEDLRDTQVLLSHKVSAISYDAASKQFQITALHSSQERSFQVDGVILTAPVPQSISLLTHFPGLCERLRKAPSYHRCLLLLLWPRQEVSVDSLKKPDFIDRIVPQTHIEANKQPIPIAVHASYHWSDKHYADDDEEILQLLSDATGIKKDEYDCIQVKRWGQAQPIEARSKNATGFEIDEEAALIVCSDALGAGNIHHAGEAGIEAARRLSAKLKEMHISKI